MKRSGCLGLSASCLNNHNIMIENNNYITVLGWMVNDLGLSGNELLCYSVIYGFCQDGESCFNGSRKYISDWLGCSLPTVDKVLKSLMEKGLITKTVETRNKVVFNSYRTVKTYQNIKFGGVAENFTGYKNSLQGYKEILHDNKDILIDIEKKENILKEKKDELFEECWKAYRRKGSKGKSKTYWDKLTNEEKEMVLPHIRAYVESREVRFQKDFERYLRDKIFMTIVFKNNNVVYDPTRGEDKGYYPETGFSILWNEELRCFYYIGMDLGFIPDGYSDDDRPDGATLILNNARGTIVWNAELKKWIRK